MNLNSYAAIFFSVFAVVFALIFAFSWHEPLLLSLAGVNLGAAAGWIRAARLQSEIDALKSRHA